MERRRSRHRGGRPRRRPAGCLLKAPERRFLHVRRRHYGRHQLSGYTELSELSRTIAEQSARVCAARRKGANHDCVLCRAFQGEGGARTAFLDAHNKVAFAWPGLRHVNVIKTGEHTFCVIAEWTDMDAIVNARDSMIATLDSFRDTLEDLGGGSASPTRFQAQW